jgi:hypothetical protein
MDSRASANAAPAVGGLAETPDLPATPLFTTGYLACTEWIIGTVKE